MANYICHEKLEHQIWLELSARFCSGIISPHAFCPGCRLFVCSSHCVHLFVCLFRVRPGVRTKDHRTFCPVVFCPYTGTNTEQTDEQTDGRPMGRRRNTHTRQMKSGLWASCLGRDDWMVAFRRRIIFNRYVASDTTSPRWLICTNACAIWPRALSHADRHTGTIINLIQYTAQNGSPWRGPTQIRT